MPLPFTPRFVDLVRTYTTTEGTQNFVPGKAVAGFSTFAQSLSAGDQFYYCAQSAQRPAEREVGRGTLQADGSIVRAPISGELTRFGGGVKTVSLVTAAEWFSDAQAALAAAATSVASTAELAQRKAVAGAIVMVTEKLRGGLFVFADGDHSVLVAADTAQAIAVSPKEDRTGKSGAWLRHHDGHLDVRWFGAVLDNSTDDGAAFTAALALSKALAANPGNNPFYKAGPRIIVPAGGLAYLGATTLNLDHTVVIEGESGSGQQGGAYASQLRWAPGVTGIRVQRYDTSGASTVDAVPHFGGDCSVIRGLRLRGGFSGTEGEHHGVHVKARCVLEDLYIDNWGGDGIRVHADAVSTGADHGNANNGIIGNVSVVGCRDGISIAGGDANAWTIRDLDTSSNRRWGRSDNAFLCNTYIGGHSADNGLVPGSTPTVVSHGGHRYAVVAGREAAASTTAPSGTTDSPVWLYLSAGSTEVQNNIPAWTSGMAVRAGGAAWFANPNSDKLVLGFYTEGGQGPIQASAPTLIIGGTQGAGVRGVPVLRNRFGVVTADAVGAWHSASQLTTTLRPNMLELSHPTSGTQSLQWFGDDLAFTVFNSGIPANWSFRLTGEASAANIGKRRIDFPNGFGLGDRKRLPGTAPPTSGTFVQGDVVENTAPVPGGPHKWICVAGGQPGLWQAVYGVLSNADPIGYAQGAGGSVTQTTNKADAVTLNRACGQIVTHDAPLAAGAVASFNVLNSMIGAADVVAVSIAAASTAGAYAVQVDQVSAGTCRVSLRNQSAAALSEAVTLNLALLKASA